jgi:hypothetical protein
VTIFVYTITCIHHFQGLFGHINAKFEFTPSYNSEFYLLNLISIIPNMWIVKIKIINLEYNPQDGCQMEKNYLRVPGRAWNYLV